MPNPMIFLNKSCYTCYVAVTKIMSKNRLVTLLRLLRHFFLYNAVYASHERIASYGIKGRNKRNSVTITNKILINIYISCYLFCYVMFLSYGHNI